MATASKSEEWLDWFVAFRSPVDIWTNHPSFLVCEALFYFLALLTFSHAYRQGGRYLILWFTTLLHGLVVECLSYFLPDIDNFWHSQSMVMLVGKRLPLHIFLFYPVFLYTAHAAVSKLHLKRWAEPFAVGLAVVALDVPFDIMGIKLLWWSWHDTDPNIFDRMYWVPWTSYYFHASFASSFCFLFHGTRALMSSSEKYHTDGFFIELIGSCVTGLFSMPFGTLQFLPIYHTLHDNFDVHTEVCVLLLLVFYVIMVWDSDRQPNRDARSNSGKGWFDELGMYVVVYYTLYVILACIEKPENIKSTGLHETLGNCSLVSPVHTASGQILSKKMFLCADDYHEDYYDFHCLPDGKAPPDGLDWYTICGKPFENRLEYIVIVSAFSFLGLFVYYQMLALSGDFCKTRAQPRKQKKH